MFDFNSKRTDSLMQVYSDLLRASDTQAQINSDLALEQLKEVLPHGKFVRLCETLQGSLDRTWGELYEEDVA